MDALGRLMKSPGGFIASWALGTCPQKCRVSLFGLSTLHGKSVPWHQDKTPHDVHESRVKRDRVLCFFVVLVIYRWMFFLNIYIYIWSPPKIYLFWFFTAYYIIYIIYIYIFVIKCLALVWKNTAQKDTWQDQFVAPPRPSHSSSRIFEAAFSWGSGRCSVEERPIRRGICYLQRQRHSQPPDEFYYPSKVKTCWNSLVEYPPVFFHLEFWILIMISYISSLEGHLFAAAGWIADGAWPNCCATRHASMQCWNWMQQFAANGSRNSSAISLHPIDHLSTKGLNCLRTVYDRCIRCIHNIFRCYSVVS